MSKLVPNIHVRLPGLVETALGPQAIGRQLVATRKARGAVAGFGQPADFVVGVESLIPSALRVATEEKTTPYGELYYAITHAYRPLIRSLLSTYNVREESADSILADRVSVPGAGNLPGRYVEVRQGRALAIVGDPQSDTQIQLVFAESAPGLLTAHKSLGVASLPNTPVVLQEPDAGWQQAGWSVPGGSEVDLQELEFAARHARIGSAVGGLFALGVIYLYEQRKKGRSW